MTTAPLAASAGRTRGVAAVTRLPSPAHRDPVPCATVDGTLALDLDPFPALPHTPELRLLQGGPRELRPWVSRFVQGVVEVTGGDRNPHQLVRCMTRTAHAELVARCALLNAVASGDQRRVRLRAQVRSVHVQQPTPYVAEVAAHVRHGERSRALAARIELLEGQWLCTALEFG